MRLFVTLTEIPRFNVFVSTCAELDLSLAVKRRVESIAVSKRGVGDVELVRDLSHARSHGTRLGANYY